MTIRGAWMEIDIEALKYNQSCLEKWISNDRCKKLYVIKANAYSAGALEIAKQLEQSGVDYFAVATLREAIELRHSGVDTPILVLGYTPESDFEMLITNNVTQTIYDLNQAIQLDSVAQLHMTTAKIHLKIDTGLSRLGFDCNSKAVSDIRKINQLNHLDLEGVYTHFASADDPQSQFTEIQFNRFRAFIHELEKENIMVPLKHCANSGAVLHGRREMQMDMVRLGVVLYGLSPSRPELKLHLQLKPIYSIRGQVAMTRTIGPGTTVGYGRTFTAEQTRTIAVLPLGYVDGIPKRYEKKGQVLIGGKRCAIIGNICMDQMFVDVTHLDQINMGDEFVLLGKQGTEHVGIEEIAKRCETNVYDIVAGLDRRLKKYYTEEDFDQT